MTMQYKRKYNPMLDAYEIVKAPINNSKLQKSKLKKSQILSAIRRKELADQEPDPQPLWHNIFMENETAIIAGETGVGKSIVAVDILDQIARAGRRVLYYDFELLRKQFHHRWKGYTFSDNFYFADWEPDPDEPISIFNFDVIDADIKATGINIICIDNITALSLKNTVDPDSAMNVMRGLKRLQKQYKVSALVAAHVPKRQQSAPLTINDLGGSKHLANFADSVFFVNFSRLGDNVRYIKHVKTRTPQLCQTFSIFIEKAPEGYPKVMFDDYLPEQIHLSGDRLDERIMAAASLRDKEGKSQVEIARLMQVNQSTVSRWLDKFDESKAIRNSDTPF